MKKLLAVIDMLAIVCLVIFAVAIFMADAEEHEEREKIKNLGYEVKSVEKFLEENRMQRYSFIYNPSVRLLYEKVEGK